MSPSSGGTMKNAHKRWSLGAALLLVAGGLLAMATPRAASAAPSPNACSQQPRAGHIVGIVHALRPCSSNATGTPPLIFHGGPVMMTPSTSPLVVTPVFWSPSGHTMSSAYTSLILTYLNAVAAASGQNTNVFSVLNEYSGSNGQIHYSVSVG